MSASTSTVRPPDFLKDWWSTASDDNICKNDQTAVRILLDKLIIHNHNVFDIVYPDQPIILARVLVALHELGASQDELVKGYYNASPNLTPFALHSIHSQKLITPDTWLTHLGDTSYYQAYLMFFSDQVAEHGIDAVVKAFFIIGPLSASIGGRLQPFVHLTFGIEYVMPHIVAQGMAYLATTYLDVSSLTTDNNDDHIVDALDPATVLFEQVAIDPRFAGRMEATDMAAYKLLLKSQGQLLCTYMRQCADPSPADLVRLAVDLVGDSTIRLAVSSQLLAAARSIEFWPANLQPKLGQLVLLAMFCTLIVEHSSTTTAFKNNSIATPATAVMASWEECADHIKAAGNPILILLFQNLAKISKGNCIPCTNLLRLVNALVMKS